MSDRRSRELVQRAMSLAQQARTPDEVPAARSEALDELDAVLDAIGWELVAKEERDRC